MSASTSSISAAELALRQRAVDDVRHSSAMEGLRSSEAAHADQDAYARGEITLDELDARSRARHGLA